MKNTSSEDWCDINSPTSIKDSLNINNELLANILKIVINLEETVKSNTNKIDDNSFIILIIISYLKVLLF